MNYGSRIEKNNHVRELRADNPIQRTQGQYTKHDELITKILGPNWAQEAMKYNSKTWIKQSRPAIDKYLAGMGTPPNPFTETKDKDKAATYQKPNDENELTK